MTGIQLLSRVIWTGVLTLILAYTTTFTLAQDPIHMVRLKATIENQIRLKKGHVGLVYYDLLSGDELTISSTYRFNPASLIKVPIIVALYQQIEAGLVNPQDHITLTNAQKIRGSGILFQAQPGSSYSLETLARLMIIESDNTATKMIIDHIGIKSLNQAFSDLGLKDTVLGTANLLKGNGKNFSTPKDMSMLFRGLSANAILSEKSTQTILTTLSLQKYRWGIPKQLPAWVVIANKTGSLIGIRNDSGVVFYKNRPYVLTIFTEDMPSSTTAKQTVAAVSKSVFDWHSHQVNP